MRYHHLRWIAIIVPALFLGIFEYVRHTLLDSVLSIWTGSILVVLAVLGTSAVFSQVIFGAIARLQADLVRQNEHLTILTRAGTELAALLTPDRTIGLAVQQARDLTQTEVAGVSLVEDDRGTLTWHLLVGASERYRSLRLQPGEGIAGYVVQTGRPLVVPDWAHPPVEVPATAPIVTMEHLRASLAVPLRSGGRTLGALLVANRAPTAFPADQVMVLASLANQVAVALENARLYEQVQNLAVLEERERIAREMHDGLAQVLGYVNTKALAVMRLLETGRHDEARSQVAQLEAAAKEVYADIRAAILGLRTTLGPERDFLVVLDEYLDGFTQQSGLPVERHLPMAGSVHLSMAAELQLLRIVQEALANVRQHARATRAIIRLTATAGAARLAIEDDGQGFEPVRPAHDGRPRFGLQTMRERAEAIGGSFAVESRVGAGTCVTITIPDVQREEATDAVDAFAPRG